MKEIRWRKDHKQIGTNVVEYSCIVEMIGFPEQDVDELIHKAKRVGAKYDMIKKGISNAKVEGVIIETK